MLKEDKRRLLLDNYIIISSLTRSPDTLWGSPVWLLVNENIQLAKTQAATFTHVNMVLRHPVQTQAKRQSGGKFSHTDVSRV